jgi:hypothetical protein
LRLKNEQADVYQVSKTKRVRLFWLRKIMV